MASDSFPIQLPYNLILFNLAWECSDIVTSLVVDVLVLILIHSGVLPASLLHSILFLGTEYMVTVAYSLLGGCMYFLT